MIHLNRRFLLFPGSHCCYMQVRIHVVKRILQCDLVWHIWAINRGRVISSFFPFQEMKLCNGSLCQTTGRIGKALSFSSDVFVFLILVYSGKLVSYLFFHQILSYHHKSNVIDWANRYPYRLHSIILRLLTPGPCF